MNRIRVVFFGSSTDDYCEDIDFIFQCLFDVFDEVVVLNGGYQGTMCDIARIGKKTAKQFKKAIFIQGILFDGYKNDPDQTGVNKRNKEGNTFISSKSIGERVQSMIELADIVISLPGKTGTLHEIIQAIETIQYGMNYSEVEKNFKRLLIHHSWKKTIDNLNSNGNMKDTVYNYLTNSLFSFEGKKEKKKEQFKNRIKLINNSTLFTTKEFSDKVYRTIQVSEWKKDHNTFSLIPLPDNNKIVKIVTLINEIICSRYFDGEQNSLVGLDIALKEKSSQKERLFRLDSVGSQRYIATLSKFLAEYKSFINGAQPSQSEWVENINCVVSQKIDKLIYNNHIKIGEESELNGEKESELKDWIYHIEKNKLGKSLYWTSVSLDNRYYISAFLLLDCYVTSRIKDEIEKTINQFLLEDALINVTMESTLSVTDYAKKAAISQVLARTTSHNTGSHILSNDLSKNGPQAIEAFRIYLRHRMLFNADLTSNSSKSYYSVKLKEVLDSFTNLEIVKYHISGLENCYFSGFKPDKDIEGAIVALPNGVLGYHALYIVFENLIRNYFKHSNGSGSNLTLVEKFKYLEINLNQLHNLSNDFYISIDITDGSQINDETYNRIEDLINKPILNDLNELRSEGLGYLEIKAALSYINDIPLNEIDSPVLRDFENNDFPVKVFSIRSLKEDDSSLRYRIFLPKSFIIKTSNSNQLNKNLLQYGIVDSKENTKFDDRCKYYFGEAPAQLSAITPRLINESQKYSSANDFISFYYNQKLKQQLTDVSIYKIGFEGNSQKLKKEKLEIKNDSYIFCDLASETKTQQSIFFDLHCLRLSCILEQKYKLENFFYEDYKSQSSFGSILNNASQLKDDKFLIHKIIEAFLTKIIIIDERIQKFADQDYTITNTDFKDNADSSNKLKTIDVLEMSGIAIPRNHNELDLNSPKIDKIIFCENLKRYLDSEVRNLNLKSFILIHLGVIEKLTEDKSEASISKIIEKIKPDNYPDDSIVFISERGTPRNVDAKYRFMHYSNVARNLVEDKSKYFLTNAVFSSRCLSNKS